MEEKEEDEEEKKDRWDEISSHIGINCRDNEETYTASEKSLYRKSYDTRFNKIAIQGKGPDGKWTRKPLAYRESNMFILYV